MERRAARVRRSVPGALFAFLTAIAVTMLGVVPPAAAASRQPGVAEDASTAAPGGPDASAAVSVAVLDDVGQDVLVPGPVATPASTFPELPAYTGVSADRPERRSDGIAPGTPRGRGPPR